MHSTHTHKKTLSEFFFNYLQEPIQQSFWNLTLYGELVRLFEKGKRGTH